MKVTERGGNETRPIWRDNERVAVHRRELLNSPASRNEFPKLELQRAWEPSGNSRPPLYGEGKRTRFGFSYGNQNL
jgi:hypothetical protein